MTIEIIIVFIISYLSGSIPYGLVLTKIFLNKDIRKIGSGNIGATNALRTGNKIIGICTLIFDILKAIIPLIFIKLNFPEFIFVSALLIFLGHVFPVWLKFKGGKGVATYLGILFCINYMLGLIFIITWLIFFFYFKIFFTIFINFIINYSYLLFFLYKR